MSVILLDEKIYKELFYTLYSRRRADELYNNLHCLRDISPEQIKDFVNELFMINTDAYNIRYEEPDSEDYLEIKVLNFKTEGRKWSYVVLYKFLQGISYNCVESEMELPKLFYKLLIEVASKIISTLPAYEVARWSSVD